MLIDSHTHLEMPEFDDDRDEVVERARKAGLTGMITVGTSVDYCRKALGLAARYEEVFVALGIHPHDATHIDNQTYDLLRGLAAGEKVVAYGEIGLDFYRNLSPPEIQIKRFGEQLEMAGDLGLPVIVHDRDAHGAVIEMLRSFGGRLRGVIHCFSGNKRMAGTCLDMGFFISIPGTVTYEKADELREVVQFAPLEGLLVETDAPYLAPVPHRGGRNEPSYVVKTAHAIASLKQLTYQEVAEATSENARSLFGIPAAKAAGHAP